MKLAIFSDVHGNLTAFNAFLEDAKAQGATDYICLGDHGNFGPEPAACLEKLEALDCPVILGNSDQRLLTPRTVDEAQDKSEDARLFADIDQWCAAQLSKEQKGFVESFAPYLELEFSGLNLLAYHGSPKSFDDPIRPETDRETLSAYFGDFGADLYLGGHTHVQFVKRYFDRRVMNPGSVGLPFVFYEDGGNANLTVAEYALLEVVGGEPNITFRRVPYSLNSLEHLVRASEMPHAERWLRDFRASG